MTSAVVGWAGPDVTERWCVGHFVWCQSVKYRFQSH